jgi:hypothetical protein
MSEANITDDASGVASVDGPSDAEIEAVYEDARSADIFDELFNPEDDMYVSERDSERRQACIDKLVANGHSAVAAAMFLDEQVGEAEDGE